MVNTSTGRSKPSNNERISTLEKMVAAQALEISQLKQQISSLCQLLCTAGSVTETTTNGTEEEAKSELECEGVAAQETAANNHKKENMVRYNYKNLLQEYCVKKGYQFPTYETAKCRGGFISEMTLRGEVFASNIQKAKVLAEKSAACIALQQHEVVDETGEPIADKSKRNNVAAKYSWCKNQLQEYFAKHSLPYPTYTIRPAEGGKGFVSELCHDKFPDKIVIGDVAQSKRMAEQMAAFKAISEWGIDT